MNGNNDSKEPEEPQEEMKGGGHETETDTPGISGNVSGSIINLPDKDSESKSKSRSSFISPELLNSIAQGIKDMPGSVINSVLNLVLLVLGSIVVFIIFILILTVYIIVMVMLFVIILFIALVIGTFILLYQIVLLIFIFYPKITGRFVNTREPLRDENNIIIPNEYMFQGTQKFNMLICFYLTFLNKTVIYYAFYVMFYMIPLTLKFFGSLSLAVTLIVAVIVGYQIAKVKNVIKNKVYGFGQSNQKDALIISAVAQEIRRKKTETTNI
jgi:hypothetical protein